MLAWYSFLHCTMIFQQMFRLDNEKFASPQVAILVREKFFPLFSFFFHFFAVEVKSTENSRNTTVNEREFHEIILPPIPANRLKLRSSLKFN